MGRKIKWRDLKYEAGKYKFHFQQYKTIISFGESTYTDKINIDKAEIEQTNLLENMANFNNKSRPKNSKDKKTFDSVSALYEGWELTLNGFKSWIFSIKATKKWRTSFGFSSRS